MYGNGRLYIILIIFISLSNFGCNEEIDTHELRGNDHNSTNETIKYEVNNKISQLVFNFESIEPTNKKRTWVGIELELKLKIGSYDSELLLTPSRVMTDRNENIYILDNIDCSVKKFNKNGIFLKKYGSKGQGPGEFELAWNFDISEHGDVVISSPNSNKFAVFRNSSVNEFKPIDRAKDICFLSSSEVLTFQLGDLFNKPPIHKINYKNNLVTPYENFLQTNENISVLTLLIGAIHRYQKNKVVYISEILGYVIIYNEEGKIENVFNLIDEVVQSGLAEREKKRSGKTSMYMYPQENEYLCDYSSVFGDNLYILQNAEKENSHEFGIDVYSISAAEYMYSFSLKDIGEFISMYFTDKLYVVKENTEVEVYNYNIIRRVTNDKNL
jgi:hypothetical protein